MYWIFSRTLTNTERFVLLHGTELNSHDEFRFWGHVFEDISFESSEHVWTQHVVQFLNLVLLSYFSKFFQETFQITETHTFGTEQQQKKKKKGNTNILLTHLSGAHTLTWISQAWGSWADGRAPPDYSVKVCLSTAAYAEEGSYSTHERTERDKTRERDCVSFTSNTSLS